GGGGGGRGGGRAGGRERPGGVRSGWGRGGVGGGEARRKGEAWATQRVCSGDAFAPAKAMLEALRFGRQAPVKRCPARTAARKLSRAASKTIACSTFLAKLDFRFAKIFAGH